MAYTVRIGDLGRAWDRTALVAVIDGYAREPMGGGKPMPAEAAAALPDRLAAQANARVWFAVAPDGEPAGIAVCFLNFSTFEARPLLNLHDLAVMPAHRRRGVGRLLLATIEDAARALGCCKLTLEVRTDNANAERLYRAVGYGDGAAPHRFLVKKL